MATLLADANLLKKDKNVHKGAEALQGKVVGLYFSAHWCPPCRAFTPVLKDFYEELEDGGEFEIVFVTFDRSQADLDAYLSEAHGDWYHLALGDKNIEELSAKYSVSGIPALIIIKPNGDVITKNGRSDVQAALSAWKAA